MIDCQPDIANFIQPSTASEIENFGRRHIAGCLGQQGHGH
jgi:hypothetical protein